MQVFIALSGMRALVTELKNKDVLGEFGGRRADGDPDPGPWNQLLDADLVCISDDAPEPVCSRHCSISGITTPRIQSAR
jgi:hypothetical protein